MTTGGDNMKTKDLKDLFPNADKEVIQVIVNGRDLLRKYNINTDDRFRMFLAQMAHESGGFRHLEELSYKNTTFEKKYGNTTRVGKILGNTEPGDGHKYRGRGIIQLTGRWNYEFYGRFIEEDLQNHPELAKSPYIAFKVALAYWSTRGVNKGADLQDVKVSTKLINGGYNGLKDRQRIYDMLKDVKMDDYLK